MIPVTRVPYCSSSSRRRFCLRSARMMHTVTIRNATPTTPKPDDSAVRERKNQLEAVYTAAKRETEDYYSVLEGLTMYAIGDSYFGGSGLGQHQTWVNLLGYKYGMTFHNYGIGGNTVYYTVYLFDNVTSNL